MATAPHGLIGVVHLAALPGDPAHSTGTFDTVREAAWRDMEALADGGADAVIFENFGSTPFQKGTAGSRIPPHQAAALAILVYQCQRRFDLKVGVNCLRNDAHTALGIAAAAGADFVRINVHTSAMLTDQGIIEGEAASTLAYRRSLGADHIAILADVFVKHAAPLAPVDLSQAVADCLLRGHADAIIVTGNATGGPIDEEDLSEAAAAAGKQPVLLGSGVTAQSAAALARFAHGAIVGTAIKQDGNVHAPVDIERVKALASALGGQWRQA